MAGLGGPRGSAAPSQALPPGSSSNNASTAAFPATNDPSSNGSNEGHAFSPGSSGPSRPPVSLPSGGGAIRGMGENFSLNASTGSASVNIPLPLSPSRNGTEPRLSLQYDTGSGSSVWGMGWDIAGLPHITRSVRNGNPTYDDDSNKDVFSLSGEEDLVPVYSEYGESILQGAKASKNAASGILEEKREDRFTVRFYRPRVETSFSRIERWTDELDPEDVHWRVFTKTNELTIFGRSDDSRVCAVVGGQKKIFTWLCCEWYDCYGNAHMYEYKPENGQGVDLQQAHEQNRTDQDRAHQRHLKRIKYGNRTPVTERTSVSPPYLRLPVLDWMFEAVFDYGEHDLSDPLPTASPGMDWKCRQDPFSSFKPGFEVRTYRLCQRVLMFHHFPGKDELGCQDYLVKAIELHHDQTPAVTRLESVQLLGFVLAGPDDPPPPASEKYISGRLPPLQFEYAQLPSLDSLTVQAVEDTASMESLTQGASSSAQWLDMLGEGTNGMLITDPSGEWYYKRNLSAANEIVAPAAQTTEGVPLPPSLRPKFGPLQKIGSQPGIGSTYPDFSDLDGNGVVSLAVMEGPSKGSFSMSEEPWLIVNSPQQAWPDFRPFTSWPSLNLKDPNTRFIDLTGDGKADLLITHDDVLLWYESYGSQGFSPLAHTSSLSIDEESGPRVLFSDPSETIHIADLSGDGMMDIVRIRNCQVCYWPNMGFGRFGAKVAMDNAPTFDSDASFTARRLIMGDIDGSGTTDMVYCGPDGLAIYYNQSGNSWSGPNFMPTWPKLVPGVTVTAVDLLGTGTMCLVCTFSGPSEPSMLYVDLSGGQKPHLLTKISNNLGKKTWITYRPSTAYYLDDKAAGIEWATRLPYPVHCVSRLVTYDETSGLCFTEKYAYHHGYWDPIEREFRGFGMVEQWDTEEYDQLSLTTGPTNQGRESYVTPIRTKTWFHTGAFAGFDRLARSYVREYYGAPTTGTAAYEQELEDFFNRQLLDRISSDGVDLTCNEWREASRAMKGSTMRLEVYADDGSEKAGTPYQIESFRNAVKLLQPTGDANLHAVFLRYSAESLTCSLERNPEDPRIAHELVLAVDEYGNALKTASVAYGRLGSSQPSPNLSKADLELQQRTVLSYMQFEYTNSVLLHEHFRIQTVARQQTWEVSQFVRPDAKFGRYDPSQLDAIDKLVEIPFEQPIQPQGNQKRLVAQVETVFMRDDMTGLLEVAQMESLCLPGVTYQLCFTSSSIEHAFRRGNEQLMSAPPTDAGYVVRRDANRFWVPSSQTFYHQSDHVTPQEELLAAKVSFFSPQRVRDAFGVSTISTFDRHFLHVVKVQDAKGNVVTAEYDYRTLNPHTTTDPNGNRQMVKADALGVPVGFALMGKATQDVGDSLEGFRANLTGQELERFFNDPHAMAPELLGSATSRLVYHAGASTQFGIISPSWVASVSRQEHLSDVAKSSSSSSSSSTSPTAVKTLITFSYVDGSQRVIQAKAQAEPAISKLLSTTRRWRTTGWTVFNNKGAAVQQYEPFFDSNHRFHFDRREGVSSICLYDPLDRPLGVLLPDKTWTKQVRTAWQISNWDAIDTLTIPIHDDIDVGPVTTGVPSDRVKPTWIESATTPEELDAARKATALANSPSEYHYDALGRAFLQIEDTVTSGKIETRITYDIQGNVLQTVDGLGRTVSEVVYDMLGNGLRTVGADFGSRWQLTDVVGQPLLRWNLRDFHIRNEYDLLRRLIGTYLVTPQGGQSLVHKAVYGEDEPNAADRNLRGKLIRQYDQAGTIREEVWDFKGNSLSMARQFAADYKADIDWSDPSSVTMLPEVWTSAMEYDALDRVTKVVAPDGSIISNGYNEAGLPDSVVVLMKGATANVPPQSTFVSSTEYDAWGRTVSQTYGNGTVTTSTFHPLTQRLQNQKTVLPIKNGNSRAIQSLTYTYDPAGNITHLRNDADQTLLFRNKTVEPHTTYTYDGAYRLVEATGRECLAQTKGLAAGPGKLSSNVVLGTTSGPSSPADASTMTRYTEAYDYDKANCITSIRHQFLNSKTPGWTRTFAYEDDDNKTGRRVSNRLVSCVVGNSTERYAYDAHGNMTKLPHLASVAWDFNNQMQSSSGQRVADGKTPETTYYRYDSQGQRVRKVVERFTTAGNKAATKLSDRLTIVGCDFYKEYAGDGTTVSLSCDTLKVPGTQSGDVAIVEDWTGTPHGTFRVIRYQVTDDQDTVSTELDETGQLVSYEEFTPYGSTSYSLPGTKTPKRFRYIGKERDTENGLYCVGLRYYLPWLGRWLSPDPVGTADGLNVFAYAGGNPISFHDTSGMGKGDRKGKPAPAKGAAARKADATGRPRGARRTIVSSSSSLSSTASPVAIHATEYASGTAENYIHNPLSMFEQSHPGRGGRSAAFSTLLIRLSFWSIRDEQRVSAALGTPGDVQAASVHTFWEHGDGRRRVGRWGTTPKDSKGKYITADTEVDHFVEVSDWSRMLMIARTLTGEGFDFFEDFPQLTELVNMEGNKVRLDEDFHEDKTNQLAKNQPMTKQVIEYLQAASERFRAALDAKMSDLSWVASRKPIIRAVIAQLRETPYYRGGWAEWKGKLFRIPFSRGSSTSHSALYGAPASPSSSTSSSSATAAAAPSSSTSAKKKSKKKKTD